MASQEMIEQLKKAKRNYGFLKVKLKIGPLNVNPIFNTNSEIIFSELQNLKNTNNIQKVNYATLEKNFWNLDGSQILYDYDELEQKYTSGYMSLSDCSFEENPVIELFSDSYLETLGISLTFDNINNNYATKVNIKGYEDEIEIMNEDYNLNSYKEKILFANGTGLSKWNKLIITFEKTNLPYRRIRINQLSIGIEEIYTESEIISANSSEKTTMINSSLPTRTFEFKIDNFDKLYNPDNPTGWYKYIFQKQTIIYEWGYQLDNKTIEYVQGGNMLLTGNVDVSDNQATFKSTSLINYLTKTYKKGVYNTNGRSLYDLAVDVFEDNEINSNQYNLWEGLKSIYTEAPLPKLETRQNLQIISTTANCTLYEDRQGIINIQPFYYKKSENVMDYSFMTSKPSVDVQNELKNSIVYINHYSIEDTVSELFKNESLEITGTSILEIEYDLATNINAIIVGGTILNSNYYGRYAILEINNNSDEFVSLTILGNKINVSQTIDSENYNDDGEDIEYTNDLVTQLSESNKDIKLKRFIGNWYNNRNIYSFENRGDILADTNTIIETETDFSDSLNGYLVENSIEWNGAWSGSSVVMKVEVDENEETNI